MTPKMNAGMNRKNAFHRIIRSLDGAWYARTTAKQNGESIVLKTYTMRMVSHKPHSRRRRTTTAHKTAIVATAIVTDFRLIW
jgi:hypothetical protein